MAPPTKVKTGVGFDTARVPAAAGKIREIFLEPQSIEVRLFGCIAEN